ncbi:MAG TPA: TetR/AcrR family transcriptional regulator C-terminal domain-containing protein [Mycobacterium sp.]|nr:TetR/AcrR family transcriptional regulator C-terminal domain-containing protein [Mycobacterium sp.]
MAEASEAFGTKRDESSRRGRGRPSQISREQIVAAARSVPRDKLTMTAIADALGVTRKALHYHVGDREGLLNLVVADLFESNFPIVDLPNADWRAVLRAYADAFRDGVRQVGVAATYVQLHGMAGMTAMRLSERVIQSLFDAGFNETLARQGLTLISNVAMMHAQIDLLKAKHGIYPQEAELTDVLSQASSDQFPGLRRILASVQHEAPDDQYEFEIDLVIAGLERSLTSKDA